MPLAHTVELNAGTVDTDTGPYLRAAWCGRPRRWITRRSAG